MKTLQTVVATHNDAEGPEPVNTVLVAGGAGFLGSHLCERLLVEGRRVICVDNLLTGSIANIAALLSNRNFSFLRHDIVLPFEPGEPLGQVYDLACAASPKRYQANPIHTMQTNVNGAINLLDLATRDQAKFFQASTAEVYGDPMIHPQPEWYRGSVNLSGPRACHDEGKRAAEALCCDYRRCSGTDVRIARIFNTYGPRMPCDDGGVISNFIVQALRSQDLTVYGDGSQTRSFCFVDDLLDGIACLMAAEPRSSGPINLGNPEEIQIDDLANLIIEIVGSSSRVVYKSLPVDDPRQRRPDIARARRELAWAPRVELSAGLWATIRHFEDLLTAADQGRRVP